MKDTYHRDIVQILLESGERGMKPCTVARRLFNIYVDLFCNNLSYERMRREVEVYLWRESKRRTSVFIHKSYGLYAIRPALAIQLDLFVDYMSTDDDVDVKKAESASTDFAKVIQLDLFEDYSL